MENNNTEFQQITLTRDELIIILTKMVLAYNTSPDNTGIVPIIKDSLNRLDKVCEEYIQGKDLPIGIIDIKPF